MNPTSILSGTSIPVLEQALYFAQARHQVLASNIANLDTPGYRVRDYSPEAFQARLKNAIHARDRQANSRSLGDTAHLQGDPFREVSKDLKSILYHDDSNVGVEQQVAAVAENQMNHNLAITILENQFRLLHAAISERP